MLKSPPAAFSHHSETQRTEAYASPLPSLRPCWTAFLSILRCSVPQFFCHREAVRETESEFFSRLLVVIAGMGVIGLELADPVASDQAVMRVPLNQPMA